MLTKICRICGRSNICDKSKNLFECGNRKLLRNIQMLTGLVLRNSSDAPSCICFCCHSDLKLSMSFRRLCIKTQKKWRTHVEPNENSAQSDQNSSSSSPSPTPTKLSNQSQSNCSYMPESTYRQSESDEEPEKTVEVMITESKIISPQGQTEHDHLAQDFFIHATEDVDAEDIIKLEYACENAVPKAPKACRKHSKIKQEAAIYICELCGTHANNKVSFERHIRKHTGERPFPCKECTARFLSAGELRAHELKHTGERPFPCRFCDRRYVSYMGRLKHERMHTNERPFVCAECGKAFTDAYILKNHMLVHTGERLFRCDLCERSFSRPTHLKTHYRSNTHKQNVEKLAAVQHLQ
ncbi:hypothetical protein KR222_007146, partial [Zaprionus bogoriensis]